MMLVVFIVCTQLSLLVTCNGLELESSHNLTTSTLMHQAVVTPSSASTFFTSPMATPTPSPSMSKDLTTPSQLRAPSQTPTRKPDLNDGNTTSSVPNAPVIPAPTQPTATTPPLLCYRKAYGVNSPVTTCVAGEHGCYETERVRAHLVENDLKMGCLKKPCKPLYSKTVVRQCCDSHLCNNLHNESRDTIIRPTLPPLSEYIQQGSTGRILCYDDTSNADEYDQCWSSYGCYRLYYQNVDSKDPTKINQLVKRTCIPTRDFFVCIYEGYAKDSYYAECCYDNHNCNYWPRKRRDTQGTPTEMANFTSPAEPATSAKEHDGGFDYDTVIAGGVLSGVVVIAIVVLAITIVLVVKDKKKAATPAPRPPPRVVPVFPPVGPHESVTVTLPMENIR